MIEITREQFDEYCQDLKKSLEEYRFFCVRDEGEIPSVFFNNLYWGVITKGFLENEITLEQHSYYISLVEEYFLHIESKNIPICLMDIEFYASILLSSLGFVVIYITMDEKTFPAPRWSAKNRIYHYNPEIEKEIYNIYNE